MTLLSDLELSLALTREGAKIKRAEGECPCHERGKVSQHVEMDDGLKVCARCDSLTRWPRFKKDMT